MQKTLLYFFTIATICFSSCVKTETDEPKIISTVPPSIEINGKTSGETVNIPEYTYSINHDHFEAMAKGVNVFEDYLAMLNYIPNNSNITINSETSMSYNWVNTNDSLKAEVWYTIEQIEGQNNIKYDMAIEYFEDTDRSISRLNIMEGWVINNQSGHIKANYGLFLDTVGQENFIYEWENKDQDFLFTVNYNLEDGELNEDTKYKVQILPDGSGKIDFIITDNPNKAYHYQWKKDWKEVDWTYTVDNEPLDYLCGQWVKP